MDAALIAGLFGAVAGGTTTGLFALFTARAQARHQFLVGHSKDLWTTRLASFKDLWTLTSYFPRYWTEMPPKSVLLAATERMHVWYFQGGGLLLTNKARQRYFDVQDALYRLAKSPKESLEVAEVDDLFRLGEALRMQLCVDLGSAKKAGISAKAVGAPVAPHELP